MKNNSSSTRPSPREKETGAVLVVVLLVMIALLGLGLTGLYRTSGVIHINSNINMRNQALYVAEAGIQTAKSVLNRTLPGNPGWAPRIGNMLAGGPPTPGQNAPLPNGLVDEIPTDPSECRGSDANGNPKRGAYLRDDPSTPGSPANGCGDSLAYVDCDYPNNQAVAFNADANDPTLAPAPTRFMGRYTLFIRQDLPECRMGLYTTENTNSTTGSPSNGIVVIRSEGVASDNRTRVVLEVTMTANPNLVPLNTQIVSVCPAGAAGCDDNASVQNGIMVAGSFTPPSGGSTAGSSGTGGAGGSGGAGGTAGAGGSSAGAGGTSPLGGSTGGGGAGGGGAGGGGAGGGAGAGGAGCNRNSDCASGQICCNNTCCSGTCCNNTCCSGTCCNNTCCSGTCTGGVCCPANSTCNNIAILGEYGIYGTNGQFQAWLATHNSDCNSVDTLTIDSNASSPNNWTKKLSNYGILIVLDVFHTAADVASFHSSGNYSPYNNHGSQRTFTDTEVNDAAAWVRSGRGLMTIVGVASTAAEVANPNKLLAKFNLAHDTTRGFGYLQSNTATLHCWISGGFPTCPWKWLSSAPLSMTNVANLQVDTGWPLKALGSGPVAFAEPLSTTTFYSWGKIGMVVDSGLSSPSASGRVVAWADEWLTYNNDWTATSQCPAIADPSTPYWRSDLNSCTQRFWNNIVAWLRANCSSP